MSWRSRLDNSDMASPGTQPAITANTHRHKPTRHLTDLRFCCAPNVVTASEAREAHVIRANSNRLLCGPGLAISVFVRYTAKTFIGGPLHVEGGRVNRVAVVAGASRGVGRGVAAELASQGFRVFATGRTVVDADLPRTVRRLPCDHRDDRLVAEVFDHVLAEAGRIDVLVIAVWGGYERMVEDGEFTWSRPFWLQPAWRWEAMMGAGVRAAFVASQHAAVAMVDAGRGLIVQLSYWSAQRYLGNTVYGIAKAATDKMASDMAHELADHGVVVVSLYPGLVRTEAVLDAGVFDLSNSESPEFLGRAVAALADDDEVMRHSGHVLVAAQLAKEYGFEDIDGRHPRPLGLADA